jgi:DNA-directed RNA polymerase subunit RPC12/RpoP
LEKSWIVRTNDFKVSPIVGSVEICNQRELVVQAIKKLGLFWGIGIVCILIPVMHFFLVPTFLILGVVLAARTLKFKHRMKAATYDCPECKKKNIIKELWFKDDEHIRCEHCSVQLFVTDQILSASII